MALLLICLLPGQEARAQETEPLPMSLVQVETKDGNKYVGRLMSKDSAVYVLVTQSAGTIRIARVEVVRVVTLETGKLKADGYWMENFQATRTFWAPTAYGLRPGESYYQNVWVLFNQFSLGITRHFSMGVGLIPTFLFGSGAVPVWATPKFSFPVSPDKLSLGIGGIIGTSSLGDHGVGFGVLYGLATLGSRDRNVTVGLGYGYMRSTMSKEPVVTISALQRISAKGYFITENYLLVNNGSYSGILSVGGRRLVNRTGIDFGLFIPVQEKQAQVVAIPWLGITAPLDKRY